MAPIAAAPAGIALAALVLALSLSGCDRTPVARATPRLTSYATHGLAVELPRGWQHAASSLTPHLFDPRERLALATYPLRYRAGACAQVATRALADLGPTDAFITLQERGREPGSSWSGFPERPARFGPRLGGPSDAGACVPGASLVDHWFAFTAAGRHFHALVAFGRRASAVTRQQAWTILDGLRVDPRVLPDWRGAG